MGITSNTEASGARITSSWGQYTVLSGATLTVQGSDYAISDAIVSGFGGGPRNSGALPGQSGGTNYPALILTSEGGIVVDSNVGFGGVVMAVNGGTAYGGTAVDSGSFAATNGGTVQAVTVGSNGGLLASMAASYGGGPGIVLDAHVQTGGYALAGGGFTIKGQEFAGSGIISNGRFDVGSTEILVSGGTDIGSVLGGTQVVSSAGYALKSFLSGGTQQVWQGGYTSGSVVSAGGRIEVYGGGVGSSIVVGSGGSLWVDAGGYVVGVQVQANAAAGIDMYAVISGATIAGGGTLTVNRGGTLYGGTIAGTTSSGGVGGLLILESGAVLSGTITMGWKSRLDVDSVQYASGAKISTAGGTIRITDSTGKTLWTGPVAGTNAADFHLEQDPADGSMILVYDKCFLKGTMILTDRGEIAVEDLVVGDRVVAFVDGQQILREIIWVGHRSATVRQGLADDEAGYPVRIRRGALGDNIPHKDLLVTPEHSMFLGGAFIPARMLVNGSSIFYDRTITQFDYYHVETDEHSIISSDGALSESYLDTGDRKAFSRGGPVVRLLNAPQRDWSTDAAAPLRVERTFVEPVFNALVERAAALGILCEQAPAPMTDDPDLHLVDGSGRVYRPFRQVNRSSIFMVPAPVTELRIVSRIARPVDTVGAFLDDRRHLGVLVGEIQIWEAGCTRQLDAHLTQETLDGWKQLDVKGQRWTDGNALLPLSCLEADAVAMLSIEILAGGPYPVTCEEDNLLSVAG